jgi:hypothetical protein
MVASGSALSEYLADDDIHQIYGGGAFVEGDPSSGGFVGLGRAGLRDDAAPRVAMVGRSAVWFMTSQVCNRQPARMSRTMGMTLVP